MFGDHVACLIDAFLGNDGADKVALDEILQPEEDRVREQTAPALEIAVHLFSIWRVLLPMRELQCIQNAKS